MRGLIQLPDLLLLESGRGCTLESGGGVAAPLLFMITVPFGREATLGILPQLQLIDMLIQVVRLIKVNRFGATLCAVYNDNVEPDEKHEQSWVAVPLGQWDPCRTSLAAAGEI